MTNSDWITVTGAIVTIIGMAVTIWQAGSARRSSRIAKAATASIQLAAVSERLKAAQEHIRDVAPDKEPQRGGKMGNRLDLIRKEFDMALSALPKSGLGSEARALIGTAQEELNKYRRSLPNPDASNWHSAQELVQDAISDLTSATQNLGRQDDER